MNAHKIAIPSIALLALFSACASPTTLKGYQKELRDLREQVSDLKSERASLVRQRDSWETQLAEANVVITGQPESGEEYPELDALGGVDVFRQNGNLVISIESSVSFSSGKATLTKEGKKTLQTVAGVLRADHGAGDYWIEGHTDSDPIKKSSWDSNRALSVGRAMAVLHFLVEECGISDDQCVVAGHGQYAPAASNKSKADRAKNRRVEIVVHAPGD
jgi:chemotaxis protein MotB